MASIDILMATYNGERFIREQIESIQSQSFADWRLLVSDDCSNDRTLDIVREISSGDPRIEIVSEDVRHGSAKANFMSLLGKSTAPYVMFCDQDDVWLPRKIELSMREIVKLEEAGSPSKPLMVFTDMKVVDEKLNVIHESFEKFSHIDPRRTKFPQLLAQSVGAGCTMMVNREAIEFAARAVDCEGVIMHDWWLSLICSAFGEIGYIDEPTSLYRQHSDNEIGAIAYSPLERVMHFEEMQKSVAETIAQANKFVEVFGTRLKPQQREAAEGFIATGNRSNVCAVFHLIKSGCWKKGMRKVGQIIVALRND